MIEVELPPKKNTGPKIKFNDKLHEAWRISARHRYWKKKREQGDK